MAALVIAALAFSSCKKLEPTELTTYSSKATTIKGSVVYIPNGEGTKYTTVNEDVDVIITTEIPTGKKEVVDGKEVEVTVASTQTVAIVDRMYEAYIPCPAGKSVKVTVKVQFEKRGSQNIGGEKEQGVIKYGATNTVKVQYGSTFVKNLTATIDGFEATSDNGAGKSSAGVEE